MLDTIYRPAWADVARKDCVWGLRTPEMKTYVEALIELTGGDILPIRAWYHAVTGEWWFEYANRVTVRVVSESQAPFIYQKTG